MRLFKIFLSTLLTVNLISSFAGVVEEKQAGYQLVDPQGIEASLLSKNLNLEYFARNKVKVKIVGKGQILFRSVSCFAHYCPHL